MVLGYIAAITSLLFCALGLRMTKKFLNPITVFCGLWFGIFFLSSMELYNLNPSSTHTYMCLFIGVLMFFLGFVANYYFIKTERVVFKNITDTGYKMYTPRYWLLYLVLTFLLIQSFGDAVRAIQAILHGNNLMAIRTLFKDSSADARRTIGNVIYNLITGPIEFTLYPLCAYNLIQKKEKIFTNLTLVLLTFKTITSGGRVTLIYFIISLVVAFSFSFYELGLSKDELKQKNKKYIKKFRWVLVVFIIFFAWVSYSRSGDTLFQDTYYYFSMEPTMFEQWSEIVDTEHLIGYGEATFNGILFHPLYLIKNIAAVPFPKNWESVFNMILRVDSQWRHISTHGITANAYASVFWYFYIDAREIGIVIYSFLFGMFCSHFFKKANKVPNVKTVCLYAMVLFAVFDTYVRSRFATAEFAAGFLLMCLIIFRTKYVKE